jgi:hypothetical protein
MDKIMSWSLEAATVADRRESRRTPQAFLSMIVVQSRRRASMPVPARHVATIP